MHPGRSAVWRTGVGDEEVERRNIVIDSPTPANHGFAVHRGLIGKAEARREVVEVLGIEGIDVGTRRDETAPRDEVGDAVLVVVEHAVIGVAHAEIDAQLGRHLKRVVHPVIERVLVIQPLQLAAHDHRTAGVAGVARQEIGERAQIAAECGIGGPRTARAVEGEAAALVGVVEDVEHGAAVLAAELELVASVSPGQVVRNVAGGIDAAEGLGGAHIVEAADGDLRRTDQRGVIRHPGVQSEGRRVDGRIVIVEGLQEVVDAERQLVDHARGQDGVLHDREVVHVAGRNLEEVADVRADVGCLCAGAAEVARGDRVVIAEAVVDLDDPVEAVVIVPAVAQVVTGGGRTGARGGGPDGQQVQRHRVDRHAILRQHALGLSDPGAGRNRDRGSSCWRSRAAIRRSRNRRYGSWRWGRPAKNRTGCCG